MRLKILNIFIIQIAVFNDLKKNLKLYFVPRINSLLFLKADFYPVYSAGNLYTFYYSLNELPGAFLVLSSQNVMKILLHQRKICDEIS